MQSEPTDQSQSLPSNWLIVLPNNVIITSTREYHPSIQCMGTGNWINATRLADWWMDGWTKGKVVNCTPRRGWEQCNPILSPLIHPLNKLFALPIHNCPLKLETIHNTSRLATRLLGFCFVSLFFSFSFWGLCLAPDEQDQHKPRLD